MQNNTLQRQCGLYHSGELSTLLLNANALAVDSNGLWAVKL